MSPTRANALGAASLTACAMLLAYRALIAAPDHELVSRWWPATVLLTVLFLRRPRKDVKALTLLVVVGLTAVTVLAGRNGLFAIGFGVANAVEVLVIVWWVTRFEDGVPELGVWADYRRWLLGILMGSGLAGLITAGTVWALDGGSPWRTVVWILFTHAGAEATILPLAMRAPRQRVRVSTVEIALHVLLLITALTALALSAPGQPVAFLLLPVLMWGAARFSRLWANVELVGVVIAVMAATLTDNGPFLKVTSTSPLLSITASAQVFVLINAITSVAFSVSTSHLRDSLRRNREHEVQVGQLLDSASGTAFIATDLDGQITLFSPGAEQLLGYDGSELVGTSTPMAFHEDREIVARARELGVTASNYDVITRPLELGQEQDTRDWTYIRRDGTRLAVSLSVSAVHDDDGQATSYLSIVRDVTDRRAAEQALRSALAKEREANRRMHAVDHAKDHFVSSVSHELRTPLTSIIGYTELMIDGMTGELSDQQHSLVEKIDRNGHRLLSLVEDLLTLTRVENGSFQLEQTPTDLREAVSGATHELAVLAGSRGVALSVALPEERVEVIGDREHLERLTLNLVSNAIKFTDAGGQVTVALMSGAHAATLTVADTGLGIPLEEQGHLFERFFRSSVATDLAIQGTGLGLNIVQSIAEAHQGTVSFESTPGAGTTFWFTVPLKTSQPGAHVRERGGSEVEPGLTIA